MMSFVTRLYFRLEGVVWGRDYHNTCYSTKHQIGVIEEALPPSHTGVVLYWLLFVLACRVPAILLRQVWSGEMLPFP